MKKKLLLVFAALGLALPNAGAQITCTSLQDCNNAAVQALVHNYVVTGTNPSGVVLKDAKTSQLITVTGASLTTGSNGNPVPNPFQSTYFAMDLPAGSSLALDNLSSLSADGGYTIMIAGYPKADTNNPSTYSVWATLLDSSNNGTLVSLAKGSYGWALGKLYELDNAIPGNGKSAYFQNPWDPPVSLNQWQVVYYTFRADGKCQIDVFIPIVNGSNITYNWLSAILDGGHPNMANPNVQPSAVYPPGTIAADQSSAANPPNDVRWPIGNLILGYPRNFPGGAPSVGTVYPNGSNSSYGSATVQRALGIGEVTVFSQPLTSDQILGYQSLSVELDHNSPLALGMVACNSGEFLNAISPNPSQYSSYTDPANPCGATSNWKSGYQLTTATMAPASPISFPATPLTTTAGPQIVTITNTSTAASLNIASVNIPAKFKTIFVPATSGVTNPCTLNQPIVRGASCNLGFTFTPQAAGIYGGPITIKTNISASGNQFKFTLQGKGCKPPQ